MSIPDEPDLSQWSDDQESALLQAIIRYKPVGIHKHFRMLAIRDYMLNQGVIKPEDSHTSIPGIWNKLNSLYDLPKLDEREDSVINEGPEENGDGASYWRDFELPRDDYEALMWERRLAPEGTQSPDWSRRESTVADTDEPRSSPVPGRGSKSARGSGRRSGRLSKLQNEVETEKSSRRTSKTASVADEDQIMEDADADEEVQGSEDENEDESEEQEDDDRKDSAKRGGRGGRRGRGRRGRRK